MKLPGCRAQNGSVVKKWNEVNEKNPEMQIRAGLAILDTPTLMLWAIIFLDVWLTEIALDANCWVGRCKFTGMKRGEATVQCWDLSVWFCLDPIMDWLDCCSTYICSLQDTANVNTLQIDIKNRFKNIIPPTNSRKQYKTKRLRKWMVKGALRECCTISKGQWTWRSPCPGSCLKCYLVIVGYIWQACCVQYGDIEPKQKKTLKNYRMGMRSGYFPRCLWDRADCVNPWQPELSRSFPWSQGNGVLWRRPRNKRMQWKACFVRFKLQRLKGGWGCWNRSKQ